MNLRDADFTYDHKLGGYPSKLDLQRETDNHDSMMTLVLLLRVGFYGIIIGCIACYAVLA
jgi:hypothetical protein